jgi:hypothetical protein
MSDRRHTGTAQDALKTKLLAAIFAAWALLAGCSPAIGQAQPGCGPDGYRILSRRWDAVLKMDWELRQDCSHPDWPAHLTLAVSAVRSAPTQPAEVAADLSLPLLVHAGDPVRLWMQDRSVRIEMTGVAEQSARSGERVTIRVTQQTEDAGTSVQRIPGIVRGQGDVEMEQ